MDNSEITLGEAAFEAATDQCDVTQLDGALLLDCEIRGTWRRAQHTVQIDAWARLPREARKAVEAEASALPLPTAGRRIEVVWNT